jgi:D-sedoheptulose 7-phosphate isomerase
MTRFAEQFIAQFIALLKRLEAGVIEKVATGLGAARDDGGRLFILGVGGSAGHANHAVNDFRKAEPRRAIIR